MFLLDDVQHKKWNLAKEFEGGYSWTWMGLDDWNYVYEVEPLYTQITRC